MPSSLFRRQRREQIEKEEVSKPKIPSIVIPPPPPPPPVPEKPLGYNKFRLRVSFSPNQSKGGAHQFVLTLMSYLQGQGVSINNLHYDLLLAVADLTQGEIRKQPKAKIVHRVDGCFYDHGYPPGVRDVNQREISKLADLVIYQSIYGKNTLEDRGVIDRDTPNVVIYNGVNRSIFKPVAHRLVPTLTLISANNSRLKIKRVDRLNQFVGGKVKVIHLGHQHLSVVLNKGVQVLSPVSFEKLNNFFGSAQAFIHTGDMDTCPNVVIQALSTGLPIIYWKSSGGVEELAGNAGLAIESFGNIQELLQDLRDNYDTYHRNALERAKLFSMDIVGQQYYDTFRKVLSGVYEKT